ncbi:winged helix-turn-helix transcriptional regulator [Methanococcoides sp. SA1]|nr:winged helix-turn-helix transcriptional regulator [Methanococcoides sp. SA1]
MSKQKVTSEDISLLHEEITGLRSELDRFRNEVTRNQTNSLFNEFRNQFAVDFINGSLENAFSLIGNEAKECPGWVKCEPVFVSFFEQLVNYARNGQVSEENISKIRSNFDEIKKHEGTENCSNCLQQVEGYFDQQVGLLHTIGVYQSESDTRSQVQNLHVEDVSSLIGDPLSSSVRVQILKALYDEGRSFTELSKLTKLRGGNLLFHLEKLQNRGMIRQRSERGEYQISVQGYEALNSIAELVGKLGLNYSKI